MSKTNIHDVYKLYNINSYNKYNEDSIACISSKNTSIFLYKLFMNKNENEILKFECEYSDIMNGWIPKKLIN